MQIKSKIIKNVYQLQTESAVCPLELLMKYTKDEALLTVLPNLSVLAVQVTAYIAENSACRSIDLATQFKVTRGAISKIMRKLIKYELVDQFQVECNKKEKLFSVTAKGRLLADSYHQIMEKHQQKQLAFLNQFDENQFETIAKFLTGFEKINFE